MDPIRTTLLVPLAVAAAAGGAAAQESGLRFDTVTLATGVRLQYAERGAPDGFPVILLHGYPDSWFSWSRILPLIPARYRVLALDQRGHGDSERPDAGYAMRDFGADVLAFMDELRIERAALVGHSMGTLVAQEAALAAPARVAGLVLVGGMRSGTAIQGGDELDAVVAELDDPVPEELAREFQESTVHVPVPPAFMDTLVRESLKLPARVWRAAARGMLGTQPVPAEPIAEIPLLLMWGEHDALITRAEQEALLARSQRARLRVYVDTGHGPHWERPEEFMVDLVEFLEALTPRGR